MIGIPYIQAVFQAVIKQSLVLRGNFFVCPKIGTEINNANIEEILTGLPLKQKYPVSLMMPPRKVGFFQFTKEQDTGYNTYQMQMLFLRPSSYTAYNQPSAPLPNTPIPTHTVAETWHDMSRCAEDFLSVLKQALWYNRNTAMNVSESNTQSIVPVTDIGNDKLCGVLLNFTLLVNSGCDIEDYPADYLELIVIPPVTDTHPTHINT